MIKLLIIFFSFFFGFIFSQNTFAVENPLAFQNNKYGVHILFTEEIEDAGRLVNSSEGDWGYVTIPIQAGDRNIEKWQKFMNKAKSLHIIPIIRLATEGDYFNTKVWRKPKEEDILDFANFLNSLYWPTKNRYVLFFNEPNRADEWGGQVDPKSYAELLNYAVTVFKSKTQDFFLISAGMDNASINTPYSMNEYEFIRQMNYAIPGIFTQLDGLGSHSYPNPAFSKPPSILDNQSIATFRYEKGLIQNYSQKNLPVFITETGWSRQNLSDSQVGLYFEEAFKTIWIDENIVTVTPFLLRADNGPFMTFSLLINNGLKSETYKKLEGMPKVKGNPLLNPIVLGESIEKDINLPSKDFGLESNTIKTSIHIPSVFSFLFGRLLKN